MLDATGFRSTLCFWNRVTDLPRDIADQYLDAIDAIRTAGVDCYLSIKAPPLRFSASLVREVFERSRAREVPIHFDSLGPEAADPTFSLIQEFLPMHRKVGCTLPGRWRRSVSDADRAVELGLRVRVVKGQWPDPRDRAVDPRVGFLEVIDRIAGRVRHAAVATHDAALAREAIHRLRAAGTPCELELLYGLPVRRPVAAAKLERVPVRLYIPYGHGWLPHALFQLKTKPSTAFRVLEWFFEPRVTALELPFVVPKSASKEDRLPAR